MRVSISQLGGVGKGGFGFVGQDGSGQCGVRLDWVGLDGVGVGGMRSAWLAGWGGTERDVVVLLCDTVRRVRTHGVLGATAVP